MPAVRDHALVLKRTAYGESSLVVHAFTRRHGRVHLLAKGAYRATSRFFCVLDFFDTLDLSWSQGSGGDLFVLRQGSVATRRRHVARDLGRYEPALALLELAELVSHRALVDPSLFALCEEALDGLQEGAAHPDVIRVVFELRFLQNLGLAPALRKCAACGGKAPPVAADGGRAAFSAGAGGRLCGPCATEARAAGRRVGTLPVAVLEGADRLLRAKPDERPALDAQELILVRDFTERYLDYHLETRPNTNRAFLAAPNRNAP